MPSGKVNLRYSPAALDDLWKVGSFIVNSGGDTNSARKVITGIQEDIKQLKSFPELGLELNKRLLIETDYRMLVSGDYNVFYRQLWDTVFIIRILKGSQDWLSLLFGAT